MKKTTKRAVLVFVIVLMLGWSMANGQTPQPPAGTSSPSEDTWQFRLIPYMWASTIDSKVSVGGLDAKTTTTFSDIWRNLAGAGMIHFEAQKGRFGFFLDPLYMKLKADSTYRGSRNPNLPGIPRDLTLKIEQWIVEFGGFYQAGKWPVGDSKKQLMTLDLLAGGRYWWLKSDLDTSSIVNPVKKNQFVDPFIGVRFTADLSERFLFNIRGDIGGFGVGSDFSWNAMALFGYRFNESVTGLLGYRGLYVNYKKGSGGARYNMTIHGPIMGVAFAF